jgi:hypothetical protein
MQNCTPDFETACNTLIIIAEWLQPRSKVERNIRGMRVAMTATNRISKISSRAYADEIFRRDTLTPT